MLSFPYKERPHAQGKYLACGQELFETIRKIITMRRDRAAADCILNKLVLSEEIF